MWERRQRRRGESENRSILVAYVHYCFVFSMKMKVGKRGRGLLIEQLLLLYTVHTPDHGLLG